MPRAKGPSYPSKWVISEFGSHRDKQQCTKCVRASPEVLKSQHAPKELLPFGELGSSLHHCDENVARYRGQEVFSDFVAV
jgi:hypothetical protein